MATPEDGQRFEIRVRGQRWLSSWHRGSTTPAGRVHGSAGICLTDTGEIVLVSQDGTTWDFPAGRSHGEETWEQTLRREVLEEACAVVTDARQLGFCRGHCLEGAEVGLILVRSIWLANVRLLEWEPRFETRLRRTVRASDAIVEVPAAYRPIWQCAFADAGFGDAR